MRNPFRFLMLVTPLALACTAPAREWFVAPPPLGDDTQSGTAEQPFATLNQGAASARAGDTVWIKPGLYQPTAVIKPAHSGTADEPITYRAQPGGEVIVDGQLKLPATSWNAVFWIDRQDWITVDGLKIINSAWFGFSANNTTGVTIQNCATDFTYASGIYVRLSSHAKILRNTVNRACQHPLTQPLKDTQECISIVSSTDFEVAHNTVFGRLVDTNNGGEGIDTKGACRRGKVHHNHIYDLVRLGIYCDAYGSELEDMEIYANTVHHTSSGIVVACEAGGTARNIRIHDNLVRDCPRLGIRLAGYLKNGPIQDVEIYHNTVVRCGFGPSEYENSALLLEASNPANRNFVIRNNLFSGNPNQIKSRSPHEPAPAGLFIIDHNLLHGPSLITGTDVITADPKFVDPSTHDFRLAADSPAIDAGADLPLPTTDHRDQPRVVDGNGDGVARRDLGAFEYQAPLPL